MTYLYNHGTNLDQAFRYNQPVSPYLWETRTGTTPPTGTFAATALNPYDSTTYGSNIMINPTGLSTTNALQANYQHFYKHGYAYQVYYVYSASFRIGGNSTRDSFVYPAEDYDPSLLKGTDYKSLNRMENYIRDVGIPKHHIGFNGIVDLPFGRNKRFLGESPKWLNEIVGGWQVAGVGNITSQAFAITATNWGPTSPLTIYRDGAKVKDCRSGVCYDANLWFNGYLTNNVSNLPAGVNGLPAGYMPYQTPINNTGATGDNNVKVPLKNGTTATVAYNPGPTGVNPFSHTILSGPIRWTADASLFKVFPLHEALSLRVNVDAFNVFNVQGYVNPDPTTGIQNLQARANNPRALQLTVRLNF